MYETTTLEILTSLIVMSVKYNCQDIRSEIVKHLMKFYPDNLADFDREKTEALFRDPPADHDFQLLSVARKLDAPIILPLMFYFCAVHPLQFIFKNSNYLSKKDMRRVIHGRERLMKFSYEAGTVALLPDKKCASVACFEKRAELLTKYIDHATFDPPTPPLKVPFEGILAVDGGSHPAVCESCVECYINTLKEVREDFWKDLPTVFVFKGWDELRQNRLCDLL